MTTPKTEVHPIFKDHSLHELAATLKLSGNYLGQLYDGHLQWPKRTKAWACMALGKSVQELFNDDTQE